MPDYERQFIGLEQKLVKIHEYNFGTLVCFKNTAQAHELIVCCCVFGCLCVCVGGWVWLCVCVYVSVFACAGE